MDFVRVTVPAMSSAVVNLVVRPRLNSVLDAQYIDVVEPGMRSVWVGGSSLAGKGPGASSSWQNIGPVTPLSTCEVAHD